MDPWGPCIGTSACASRPEQCCPWIGLCQRRLSRGLLSRWEHYAHLFCEHIYIHICINLSFIVYSKIHSPKCPLFLQYRLKYFSHRAFCNVCGETVSGLFPRALRCNGMKYFAFWKTRVRCLHVLYFVTTYSALPDRSDTIIKCDRFPRLLCCVDTPLFFFFSLPSPACGHVSHQHCFDGRGIGCRPTCIEHSSVQV